MDNILSRLVDSDFCPDKQHPYYIVRSILYRIVLSFSKCVSGRILDFGCGRGPYRSLFGSCEYLAVDFPNTGHPEHEKQIDVYWDGLRLSFADNSFDYVLFTEVIEHLFEPTHVLVELHRVLKPGGKLLLTTPFIWELHETPYDYARYTPFGLGHIAKQVGFKVHEENKHGTTLDVVLSILMAISLRNMAGKPLMGLGNRILNVILNSLSSVARLNDTINRTGNHSGYYLVNEFILIKE